MNHPVLLVRPITIYLSVVIAVILIPVFCGTALAGDSVGLYDVYERVFTEATNMGAAEKSHQEMTVVFTKHGQQEIILPGFWDGGNIWKFRISFPEKGTWRWKVKAPGRNFDRKEGKVRVIPSSNNGFVQRNPDYPHTVSYSRDRRPVFVWGNTGYDIVKQELEGNTTVWQKFVDKSKEYGMNKIRLLVTMWNFGKTPVDASTYCPWDHCSYEDPHYDAFNTTYWQALDRIVRYMQAKGVIADIILFPDGPVPDHNDNGKDPNGREGMYNMSKAQETAYTKYAVARFAAYTNVIWCIANEWNLSERERFKGITNAQGSVPESWVNDIGQVLYNNDPYLSLFHRLASVHNTGRQKYQPASYNEYDFAFSDQKWAIHDVVQYHREDRATKANTWGHFSIRQNWDDEVPVFNDEYGYEGYHCTPGWPETSCTTPAMSRKAGWGIAIAGGYGSWGDDSGDRHGDHKGAFGYAGALLGIWRGNAKTPPAIKVMTGIMRSLAFWKMSPNDQLIVKKPSDADAYLLADTGRQYLMYVANGGYEGEFTIHFKAGSYKGKWIETTSGKQLGTAISFTLGQDKNKTLKAPDFSQNTDVVLKIVSRSLTNELRN